MQLCVNCIHCEIIVEVDGKTRTFVRSYRCKLFLTVNYVTGETTLESCHKLRTTMTCSSYKQLESEIK